ncbi:Gfo/Idh/MocA family protein [Clostridium cellulovorans]|uniref:Oxidoreductase domain protein n=1 Tax=Clostridium cellulovorans (strain ATCC 35296 / DSM 3052 / OCM 3 / 743B) TaxID=573061 RepID=D9SS32_CLOC7|nr:Gfo/Idh/MocA family oxidoreductase [Clostridium cellulovorans]ADL52479.1 oxidoreductase domain protein [Clostridium cellulovorans 743B]
MNKVKWGIMGTGAIANTVTEAIKIIPEAELVAVASRTIEKAEEFKNKHGMKLAFSSYEELAKSEDIDIVYVATPHSFHKENAILCINNGKHVLCEKPFTINAKEAKAVIDFAEEKQVFLMEAMWTKFLPVIKKAKEWVDNGEIGDVTMVNGNFCFYATIRDAKARLFNPELAGGSLLDIGIYPISIASMIFGREPEEILTTALISETNVDEQAAMIFKYPSGAIATLSCSFNNDSDSDFNIFGTKGRIHIPSFWGAVEATLVKNNGEKELFRKEHIKNGYEYEIQEVCDSIINGKVKSDFLPPKDTLAILRTLDKIREIWGLKYPLE